MCRDIRDSSLCIRSFFCCALRFLSDEAVLVGGLRVGVGMVPRVVVSVAAVARGVLAATLPCGSQAWLQHSQAIEMTSIVNMKLRFSAR